jgi:hypothetical protein
MKKSRTTSYHPMGNGMITKAYLGPMIHSYNCTRHESTGQTPYLLMFGRNPRLPIDVTLGLHVEEQQPSSKCISDLCIPSVYINVDVCPVDTIEDIFRIFLRSSKEENNLKRELIKLIT